MTSLKGAALSATAVVNTIADVIIRFRDSVDRSSSPLTSSGRRDEIVAYLLDPTAGSERLNELCALLTEILRLPLTLLPGKQF